MRALLFGLTAVLSGVVVHAQPSLATLYSFSGGNDGANPEASLVSDPNGTFVGTTPYGGAFGYGTAFALRPPATSGNPWTESVLYSFQGGNDGANPSTALTRSGKVFYGATFAGGSSGAGTVFELQPPAVSGGVWTETVLYSFKAGSDGSGAGGGVALGKDGVLYGTTFGGGTAGAGTVFQLSRPAFAGGSWTEAVIYSFQGGSDGSGPESGVLVQAGGKLAGTTCCGTDGTVFNLFPPSAAGGTWTKSILHDFATYTSGAFPVGTLVADSSGVLYGTTSEGGKSGAGIVFSLAPPAGKGKPWNFTMIYSFMGQSDGGAPYGALALGANGVLYGTTTVGGTYGVGTVVQLNPPTPPDGVWTENVLYSFTGLGDGSQPYAGVVIGSDEALYGTTVFGGAAGYGTAYELVP